MTNLETKQAKEIEKLKRKVTRLEKRFLEKKAFETVDLIQRGSTPQFIQKIHEKDAAALSD